MGYRHCYNKDCNRGVKSILCAYKENKRSNETVNKFFCRAIYSCFTEDGLSEK